MPLHVTLRTADAVAHDTSLLIVPVATSPELPGSLASLDGVTGGAIGAAWQHRDFTGKRDETAVFYRPGDGRRILLVGMGDPAKLTRRSVRRAAMIGGKRARMLGVANPAIAWPSTDLDRGHVAQAIAEGVAFGAWQFTALRKPADPPRDQVERVDLLVAAPDAAIEAGLVQGNAIAAGQRFTRELQVLPADTCTPAFLAARATELAERHGFKVTVLDRAALEREGMQAILAVGKGSANEPRFIALEYEGADEAPVVLVGKGVTFDTGGISIKPAQGMEEMKYDMSGAAAVLGTFETLGTLRPAVRVIGLIPSAENMLSGNSYRPGDVVGSHLGKTIEVLNTDAEGRLLLADALSWARRYQPRAVVDCATLTGAVVIGLGHTATAVMGNDEDLIAELRSAGEAADERLWPLPMWDEYHDLIKSDIADMKNTGGRPAGTITAAWFLREFAEEYPWAHLDIAGTAYTDRELPTQVKGPTGVLVRLFSEFLLSRA
jgi:leucyl aminopeptidase